MSAEEEEEEEEGAPDTLLPSDYVEPEDEFPWEEEWPDWEFELDDVDDLDLDDEEYEET